jgi:hypothetical protein
MSADAGHPDDNQSGAESQRPVSTVATAIRGFATFAWLANVLMLGVLVAEFFRDERLSQALAEQGQWLLAQPEVGLDANLTVDEVREQQRFLRGIAAAALVSAAFIVASLFLGAPRHRSIRSWLALMALLAAWLLVLMTWPEIAWAGQRWRVSRSLDEFEAIAAPLRDHWPTDDGVSDALGAYSAYPIGHPQMLQIIAAPQEPKLSIRVTAVERSPEGALRFELGGGETGAWLEWHPEGSRPASFAGALMFNAQYTLTRSTALGGNWHLTRYAISGFPR